MLEIYVACGGRLIVSVIVNTITSAFLCMLDHYKQSKTKVRGSETRRVFSNADRIKHFHIL